MKTTKEVAAHLGISFRTLLKYLERNRHLAPGRHGKAYAWTEIDIEALVKHRRRPQFNGGRPPYKTS